MSGKPAARISDGVSGGRIVSGSGTVLIGSQGGVACSQCPGGVAVGHPVSPALGAKLLMGAPELDFALPGALALAWQRQYSSYVNPEHGAPCGPLGHGWSLPGSMRIEAGVADCLVISAMGRVIRFEPLAEGASVYSPSEDLWLLRGGAQAAWPREPRFARVPAALGADPDCIVVANGQAQSFWVLARERVRTDDAPAAEPARESYLLQHLQDRFGRRQSFQRDDFGRVAAIVDGVGRHYRLSYRQVRSPAAAEGLWQADSGWRLTGVELTADPLAPAAAEPVVLVRYGYSPEGDLLTVHDRAGRLVREFAWQRHLMVGHRHLGGPRHGYRYERLAPGARVVEHFNEEGVNFRFDYETTPTGRQTRVTDSLQRVALYRFEGEGGLARLVEHVRADGSRLGYAYDAAGRLVEATDALGAVTRLRYDGQGRALGSRAPDGAQSSLDHDEATGLLLQAVDAAGRSTRMDYDDWGRLVRLTRPGGQVERFEYPAPDEAPLTCEHPTLIVDAKGGQTRLAWNAAGQLVRRTDCSGRSTEAQYDARGLPVRHTDALGQSTRFEYDAAGLLEAVHHPDGSSTRYRRDGAGRVVRISFRDEGADQDIGFAHDLWGRVTRRWQRGLEQRFGYDEAGRLVRLVNENGAASRFAWDAMDRLVEQEGFDGRLQCFAYDAAGRLVEALDGRGREALRTRYQWDALGRLAEIHVPATPQAPARIERLQWDAAGQLGATRSFVLQAGAAERLETEALFERDPAGHLLAETQRVFAADGAPAFEHRISHTLDALGQRQSSRLQDLGRLDYLTYGAGHLHGLLHEGRSLVEIERDGLHREVRRRLPAPDGGDVLEVQRRWDARGRMLGFEMTGLQRWAAAGEGAPAPLVGQLVQRDYVYDDLGQLVAIRSGGGLDRQFRYDAAGRLVGSEAAHAVQRWRFDPAGNRLPSLDEPPLPSVPAQVARWDDNRIGHGDDAVFGYDGRGNRTESLARDGRRLLLRYDGANRLVEAEAHAPDGSRTLGRYLYDVHGRRLAKIVIDERSGRERRSFYGWDGDRLVHAEHRDPAGERQVVHTVYEPGSFTPMLQLSTGGEAAPAGLAALAAEAGDARMQQALHQAFDALPREMREQMEAQARRLQREGLPAAARALDAKPLAEPARAVTVRHYHCDHLGTPQALSDEVGRLVWLADCDPWGRLLHEHNPQRISQPIRLPGQHHDAETGLSYNRHRYYDAALGSYTSQDPIGLAGGIAPFAYAQQNPLQYTDPMGLYADATAALPGLGDAPAPAATQNCPDCVQVADAKSVAAACLVGIFLIFGLPTGGRINFPAPPPRPIRVEQQQEPKKCV